MVDDVNTQTEKALAPIQLADASGPQPLADERNNQFLQELFDKKAIDPIANSAYDVKSVVQSYIYGCTMEYFRWSRNSIARI